MKKYTIKFKGCKLGSIGKPVNYTIVIEAENFKEAKIRMYDTHEHIFITSVNGKPYSYLTEVNNPI